MHLTTNPRRGDNSYQVKTQGTAGVLELTPNPTLSHVDVQAQHGPLPSYLIFSPLPSSHQEGGVRRAGRAWGSQPRQPKKDVLVASKPASPRELSASYQTGRQCLNDTTFSIGRVKKGTDGS